MEEKGFCLNRLPICYNPNAPQPEVWLRFLSELLEPEDILTLQEFMGYCLIPCTRGQVMLLIKGNGGEGKSRIGVVMHTLFGANAKNGSIDKVENSAFARADLQHVLVMVDDDTKMEALSSTHYVKSIITAETPMDLERKKEQSFQGDMYVRFMAFSNGDLEALYDKSEGFFRRQLILQTRRKPPGRVDDPFLSDKLKQEVEGIFLWCLEGLKRLQANSYCLEQLKLLVGKKEKQTPQVVFHTDQGSVYSSRAFCQAHEHYNILRSMSREGTPTDNPIIEALNGWMKEELYLDFGLATTEDVFLLLDTYVHYFNNRRPAAALGYKSPVQYKTELGF